MKTDIGFVIHGLPKFFEDKGQEVALLTNTQKPILFAKH